jgi:hypothetical protein
MMILACLQVTRNPTDQQHQLSITHIDQATYAMADKRGPSDTKFSPVDSTLEPWIRVGYENRLNTVISFNTFITYSTKAATNSLVSEKELSDRSTKATHLLLRVTVCVSALTQIDNVTANMIAEKDLRRNNILRKR